jgi:hypothetical protein
MVRRHRNRILLLFCLQAMAVAIICFGSLINFHQYKIWGKPLIPNFVGYKRDVEKYLKTASFTKASDELNKDQTGSNGFDLDLPSNELSLSPARCSVITGFLISQVPASNRVSSCGLRGPPVS